MKDAKSTHRKSKNMKLIANSSDLLKNLSPLEKIIPKNPLIPILENFLFEVEGDSLKVTVSDLQITAFAVLSVECKDTGRMAIPAKLFIDTLKKLDEQVITLTYDDEKYNLLIKTDAGNFKLSSENPADFPALPKIEKGTTLRLASEHLKEAIDYTFHATSQDELRPAMNGLYMKFDKEYSDFVATDGHRLVRYRRTDITHESKQFFIISRRAAQLIPSWLSDDENENVELTFDASNLRLNIRNLEVYCRLVDERFPDYENVIPEDNDNVITFDRQEALYKLNLSFDYANQSTHQVRLHIKENKVKIVAKDSDFSNEADGELSCAHEGGTLEVGFNAHYLIELFGKLRSKKVIIKLKDAEKASVVVPDWIEDEQLDVLALVMPMSLNN